MKLNEQSLEVPESDNLTEPIFDDALESELDERFAPERIGDLCNEFLEQGTGINLRSLVGDRQFVVAYIHAESPYSDIPRSVETTVFANAFKLKKAEVVKDYGKYDPSSYFASVIDVSTPKPVSAGALRITEYDPQLGFKDVNDLISDPESPWLDEIKDAYFEAGEVYDPVIAWQRMAARAGVELNLEESLDIATHASAEEYRDKHGSMDGVSMLFFHACLRYTLATRKKNLLAIFDLKPLANLQQYGEPFDTYEGLSPHPYGGPGDTMPAFCLVQRGIERIRQNDEAVAQAFEYGTFLDQLALFPNEYLPEIYSDKAVGLKIN